MTPAPIERIRNVLEVSRWSGVPVPQIASLLPDQRHEWTDWKRAHEILACIARSLEPRA